MNAVTANLTDPHWTECATADHYRGGLVLLPLHHPPSGPGKTCPSPSVGDSREAGSIDHCLFRRKGTARSLNFSGIFFSLTRLDYLRALLM